MATAVGADPRFNKVGGGASPTSSSWARSKSMPARLVQRRRERRRMPSSWRWCVPGTWRLMTKRAKMGWMLLAMMPIVAATRRTIAMTTTEAAAMMILLPPMRIRPTTRKRTIIVERSSSSLPRGPACASRAASPSRRSRISSRHSVSTPPPTSTRWCYRASTVVQAARSKWSSSTSGAARSCTTSSVCANAPSPADGRSSPSWSSPRRSIPSPSGRRGDGPTSSTSGTT